MSQLKLSRKKKPNQNPLLKLKNQLNQLNQLLINIPIKATNMAKPKDGKISNKVETKVKENGEMISNKNKKVPKNPSNRKDKSKRKLKLKPQLKPKLKLNKKKSQQLKNNQAKVNNKAITRSHKESNKYKLRREENPNKNKSKVDTIKVDISKEDINTVDNNMVDKTTKADISKVEINKDITTKDTNTVKSKPRTKTKNYDIS